MGDISMFGGWLKRCRQEQGLTQDELAERVACATQTIRKIEGGQRRPSFQMAERLAHVLDIAGSERSSWMRAARSIPAPEETPSLSAAAQQAPATPRLPAYLTPFIGRERERSDLLGLLSAPNCRLITLLGPGGIGKTRLATEVGRHVAGFADGVAFVSLAPLAAPAAIVPAIGDALGFTFSGPTNLQAQLLVYLRDKQILLILDNLEHLLDPDGVTLQLIDALVAHAPSLKLLVTSRERLKLAGEWLLEVDGLPVPPLSATRQTECYPAITLFVENAQRVHHSFCLTNENANDIATICRLVGGMPLGIELAAAWMRILSPDEIGQELARNLDAQHLSPGTLPTRHHSLRSVVDHSWRLLSDEERHVLRRLAVFEGGFSRTAACEVAGANLAVLASLADKSLLRRAANGRYDLHEIIKQYAAARLAEDQADRDATYQRHAAFYATWLAEREAAIKGATPATTLAEISNEIDNVRAMWRWAVAQQRLDELRRAAETLQWFFEFRSWYAEGAAHFADAIAMLRRTMPHNAHETQRHGFGQLLGNYSYLVSRIGALEEACAAAEQSRVLLADSSDIVARSRSDIYQGMLAMQVGNYDRARSAIASGLELADRNDQWTRALGETWASMLYNALGDYDRAEGLFRAGLARYRTLGNPRCLVFCITFCSTTLIALGKVQEAQTLLRESLMLAGANADRFGMAISLQHLGLVALQQDTADEAVYMFREACELMRATSSRWDLARALNQFGAALWASGETIEAESVYREALGIALEAQAIPDALQALTGLATQLQQKGRSAEALRLVLHILVDPASRTETRRNAFQLRDALQPQLTPDQIVSIESQAQEDSLGSLYHYLTTKDENCYHST